MIVRQFYNKNHFTREDESEIILQSYESDVARIDKKSNILEFGVDWDYSRTTLKNLYLFIADYVNILQNSKDISKTFTVSNKKEYLKKLLKSKKIIMNYSL